jgi:hypothetical protein
MRIGDRAAMFEPGNPEVIDFAVYRPRFLWKNVSCEAQSIWSEYIIAYFYKMLYNRYGM